MSFIGHLEESFTGKTNWFECQEHLKFYLMVNGINDNEKKKSHIFKRLLNFFIFYALFFMHALCSKMVVFYDILENLDNHFSLPSEILCNFKFNKRDWQQEQPIAYFIADFSKFIRHCNFGNQLNSIF